MINVDAVILLLDSKSEIYKNKVSFNNKLGTVIENIIEQIIKANCFKNIVAVCKDEKIQKILNKHNVRRIYDLGLSLEKSEAIKLAFKELGESEGTMFFSGIQPFIDYISILEIWETFIQNPEKIIVPYVSPKIGNPIIFPKKTYKNFNSLKDDEGGMEILKRNIKLIETVNIKNHNIFFEIESDLDYELLKQIYLRD